ncbi:MAG: tyrosine--tRNA ligase [Planctomycetota bacterium]|nr:tyrosine--tRNA ligase [Planctomycetota bacterium]MDA1177998.1 tyrosine--tRNA ligase [Planctomycetota bacterium]
MLQELEWRGLVHQMTDRTELNAWLNSGVPRTVYAGFDPTADSLHVGSLLPLLMLRRFQRAGHRPIALVGGATGMIGDPSGKSQERNLLTPDVLQHNVAGIRAQMSRFLDFDRGADPSPGRHNVPGQHGALLVNNLDWMDGFSFLSFLRDVGKHFPVNVMMAKDSVKSRLEREDSGISYTEFSYMLLQAYDFVHLRREHDCRLQLGGSDQWGNITAGIDLSRRIDAVPLHGLTCPLLTKSDGSKMGKTESGAIWLDAKRTSPYEFFQYWRNVSDDDVSVCLRMLTDVPQGDIESLDSARAAEPHLRASQQRLAEELTRLVHGESALANVLRATDILFGAEITDLDDLQLLSIFHDVPSVSMSLDSLQGEGFPVVDAFVNTGLCRSKGEARRTVEQGGAYINNRRVDHFERKLTTSDLASPSVIVLRSGRKKYALLRLC